MISVSTILTRKQESLIRSLGTRHGRRESGFCLVEGLRTAREAVQLRPDLVELCILREGTSFPEAIQEKTVTVPEKQYETLCGTVNSQGVLLLCREPGYLSPETPISDPWVLLLDRVADPGNFGTILRTARAAGLHELSVVKGGVDPFGEKALRSGMGAQFAMGIRKFESLDDAAEHLKKMGVKTFYRTEPAGGNSIFKEESLFESSAVILGNEANGAAPLEGAVPLVIPMPGSAESLNVAQAGTIVLFEYVRRAGF